MSSSPSPLSPSIDVLLREAPWVRRIARALVRGADRVDELEQETWVTVLSHPPPHGGDVRRWLSAVTRNVARHLFRSDATREHHEGRGTEPSGSRGGRGTTLAAGEIVARVEVLKRVASAVLALEEPYRSTLLARYFDEIPSTEIARALNVSIETVRTRLKRGLAQLRERLDSLRPEGSTLEAMLLPICTPWVGAVAPVGAKVAAIAAAMILSVSIAWLAVRAPRSKEAKASDIAADSSAADGAVGTATAIAQDASTSQDSSRSAAAPAPEVTPNPSVARPASGSRVTGRFLLPDGSPAKGVEVRFDGWPNADPESRNVEIKARSANDGSFSIEFSLQPDFNYRLIAHLPEYVEARWQCGSELQPGVFDLGDVPLERAGLLRVRLVDRNGKRLNGTDWSVIAEGPANRFKDGRQPSFSAGDFDESSSEFVLSDAGPGVNQLKAWWHGREIAGPSVEIQSDRESVAEIVDPGPVIGRLIRVVLSTKFWRDSSFVGHAEVVVSGAEVDLHRTVEVGFFSSEVDFEDLPPGQYSVEVHAKDCQPWKQTAVPPGSSLDVELVGTASIRLRVVDDRSGDALSRYSLSVVYPGITSTHRFMRLEEGSVPPADGVFQGLWSRRQMLVVRASGYAPRTFEFSPPAEQVTDVTMRMVQGATLAGTVFHSDGKSGAEGVEIRLDHATSDADFPETGDRCEPAFYMTDERRAVSGKDGEFTFPNVVPGHYIIETVESGPLCTSIDDVEVTAADTLLKDLDLVLPGRGFLVGRIVSITGTSFAGLKITVGPPKGGDAEDDGLGSLDFLSASMDDSQARANVQPDGAFRVGPLRAGTNEVSLQLPDFVVPSSQALLGSRAGARVLLGSVSIVDGKEIQAEFDVRNRMPGSVLVKVTEEGRPAVGTVVELVREPDPIGTGRKGSARAGVGAATVGADGSATLVSVPVGKVRCVVHASDASWAWWSDAWIAVDPGARAVAAVDFKLFDGRLKVIDSETGAAVALHEFSIARANGESVDEAIGVRSDANGVVHLRLAPGRYAISDVGMIDTDDRWHTFDFTVEGASVEAVSLQVLDLSQLGK